MAYSAYRLDLATKREKELKKIESRKERNLINAKNPEWKVLVTEDGFVREKIPFSEQAKSLISELGNPPSSQDHKGSSLRSE